MDFQNDQPIYIQIGTFIKEQIINGTIKPGEKLPSVREYAVLFEVSPLTIHRTIQYLEAEGIIVTRKDVQGTFADQTAEPGRVPAFKYETGSGGCGSGGGI